MNKLKEGISLRKIHNWLIVIAVIVSAFMIYTTYRLTNNFMHVRDALNENIALESAIDSLMEASDYLTENAQRFTVHGDRRYMDQYFKEALNSKRREQAIDEMQLDPKATAAVERLQEALRHSIKLMDREYYSMRLVVEAKGIKDYPDQIKQVKLTAEDAALSPDEKMHRAAELVLDDGYYEQKNWIRREVKNSLQAVEELIQTEETKALDGFQNELNLGRAGIILQILAIFFVVWLTASQGINPILHAVEQIKADSPIRETGANEFRYLANAYNNLYAAYRKSIANLNFKASHDELTGAYNRAGYDLLVSSLDMKSTYLLFFDLDNFKVINDTYGHEIGDKVLQKLVRVLKGSFRSDDYICRLGGDEFVVFMVHSDEMQRHLVERKMVNINQELQKAEDGIPPFSASVGIVHGTQAADAEALLKKGDEAMYQSKKQGKHTFTFYTA